jgi:hypothetical protein
METILAVDLADWNNFAVVLPDLACYWQPYPGACRAFLRCGTLFYRSLPEQESLGLHVTPWCRCLCNQLCPQTRISGAPASRPSDLAFAACSSATTVCGCAKRAPSLDALARTIGNYGLEQAHCFRRKRVIHLHYTLHWSRFYALRAAHVMCPLHIAAPERTWRSKSRAASASWTGTLIHRQNYACPTDGACCSKSTLLCVILIDTDQPAGAKPMADGADAPLSPVSRPARKLPLPLVLTIVRAFALSDGCLHRN